MRSECTLARALRLPAIALAGTLFATGAFAAPPKPAAAPRPEAAPNTSSASARPTSITGMATSTARSGRWP